MVISTFYKGKSLTLLIQIGAGYNMARIESLQVYIGSKIYPHTISGQEVRVELKSDDTAAINGSPKLTLSIDDSLMGVFKHEIGNLAFATTNATSHNSSINTGVDVVIPIAIVETLVTVGDVTYNFIKGEKGEPGEDGIPLNIDNKVDKVQNYSLIADADILRLANTSGTNTGDQDLSGLVVKETGKTLYSDTLADARAAIRYTDGEKSKLAGLDDNHWKGKFTSEALLNVVVGVAGDYAAVDLGIGSDVVNYIWDTDDTKWVQQLGISTAETAATIKTKYESNADTNCLTDALKSNYDAAYTDKHTHSNKSILDNIQEALTTALKLAYDGAVSWISTNGSNLVSHLSNTSNPHGVTAAQVGAVTLTTNQNVVGRKVFDEAYVDTTRLLVIPTYTSDFALKTITLSATKCVLFSLPNGEGTLQEYDIPSVTLTVTGTGDGQNSGLYIDYNGGSPIYAITTLGGVINSSNKVFAGIVLHYAGNITYTPDMTQYRWGSTQYMMPIASTSNADVFNSNGTTVIGNGSGHIDIKQDNTIIGDESGVSLSQGIRNTFIGFQVNQYYNGTNNSVLIGKGSSVNANDVYNAVAVGTDAQVGENSIAIGNNSSNVEGNTIQIGSTAIPMTKLKVQTTNLINRDLISNIDGKQDYLAAESTIDYWQTTQPAYSVGKIWLDTDAYPYKMYFAVGGVWVEIPISNSTIYFFNGDSYLWNGTDMITISFVSDKADLSGAVFTGNVTFDGNGTFWEDLNMNPTNLTGGGTSPARILFGSTNIGIAAFSASQLDEVEESVELPHRWKLGSTISFHVHQYPTNTDTGVCRYGLEYFFTEEGVAVTTTTTIYLEVAQSGTAWAKKSSSFADITPPSTLGSQFHFRFFRDAAHANDTYTGAIAISTIGIHYESDSLGSNGILTK